MLEMNFLADLSDIDLSVVYALESISDDGTPLVGDVCNDYYAENSDISDEEVQRILTENGFYRSRN